jgi:FtsP/CotA-like multicopper oxidase with cupredoxin domain
MTTRAKQRIGLGLVLALAAVIAALLPAAGARQAKAADGASTLVCTHGSESGGVRTFDLKATAGYISTPDGNSVRMWSYAAAGGSFQEPGPILCANEGEQIVVHLTNNLAELVSISFPGQEGVEAKAPADADFRPVAPQFDGGGTLTSFVQAAAPADGITYRFNAASPGTYLYESGTEPDKQVQMGLYGALIIRPAGHPDWAYNDERSAFDPAREYLILMHDIDPELHHAVERGRPYHASRFTDRYWTVNGRSFPDSIADNGVPWLPSQPYGALVRIEAQDPASPGPPALIRMLNAGMVNHPFHPHANHVRTIARDGRLLTGPAGEDASMDAFTKTIGSGETADMQFTWLDLDAWTSGGNPYPVQIPGLQNLVFKDDFTFYSGSPYLGEQDELPVGTTSYNDCGEFFFPWHSHALNEFQNFDEGFGGLATLVRVDPPPELAPPGGC